MQKIHFDTKSILILPFFALFGLGDCSKGSNNTGGGGTNPPPATNDMDCWMTTTDQSVLLQKQSQTLSFTTVPNSYNNITIDEASSYQTVDGFGFTFTGGSAFLINHMDAASRAILISELFGNTGNAIGISYLRISIGASDLNSSVFTYDDMPAGQTDPNMTNFNLSLDTVDMVPVLKQILTINPNIKILGSPWTAPVWMKDNGSSVGGSLQPANYAAYAKYFVKYVQAMATKGITIDAITVQNEPQNPGNNPSMVMTASQQADFIKNNLGPAFQAASIRTKIILWDHNCDNPTYPITVLNDAAARPFIDGSAFHLYAGDISALSTVHNAYPDKQLYFTEQWTGSTGSFDGDLNWHTKNVIIGSMRNWSRNALEWNLCSDPFYGPHTAGGCTQCKGAVTINASAYNRNVSYYIIAQASRFIPAGSVRIASNLATNLPNVAFKTPAGKKVLIVLNENSGTQNFNISDKGKWVSTSLPGGTVATFIW